MIRVFSIFLLIVLCQEAMAKTIFCKGRSCNDPDYSLPQLDVLVSQIQGDAGLVSELQTFHPSRSHDHGKTGDYVRRLYSNGSCLIELGPILTWKLGMPDHLGGFGICKYKDGTFVIGDFEKEHQLSSKSEPFKFHGVISTFDAKGKHAMSFKFRYNKLKATLRDDEAVPNEIFQKFRRKIEDKCWYGDCKNGFGIKLVDEDKHNF